MKFLLQEIRNGEVIREREIVPDGRKQITFGRGLVDYSLPDVRVKGKPIVSRYQATLVWKGMPDSEDGGAWFIVDGGVDPDKKQLVSSANGIYIGSSRIHSSLKLTEGMEIYLSRSLQDDGGSLLKVLGDSVTATAVERKDGGTSRIDFFDELKQLVSDSREDCRTEFGILRDQISHLLASDRRQNAWIKLGLTVIFAIVIILTGWDLTTSAKESFRDILIESSMMFFSAVGIGVVNGKLK